MKTRRQTYKKTGKNAWGFSAFLLFVLLTGCIHEFPEKPAVNPYLVDIDINIDIDMQIDSDTLYQTYAGMLEDDYDIRYIIDIYKKDETQTAGLSERVQRIVKTENNIITGGVYRLQDTLKLPVDKYEIMVWMDFVTKGTKSDKYYNTADLQKIAVIPQEGQYTGYNTTKDAFKAKVDMDLTPFRGQRFIRYTAEAAVKRPFAVYRIITTDIDEYMTYHQTLSYASIKPSSTRLVYNLFFPMGYNAYLGLPGNYLAGIHYTYDIMEIVPQKEAVLASDFVFVEDDTFYTVNFEIFSADKQHINTVNNVRINLKRNKVTILRSEFLTKDLDDGHVGIDDRFGDEIIIEI